MGISGDAPPAPAAGDVIAGKYLVERVIGEGGMGIVVVAMHQELRERVALKFLRANVDNVPDLLHRFRNEARAAAKLKSPHVARVLDVAHDVDQPYMVMEYLEGQNLHERVKKGGQLVVEEAVELAIQACEGLAEAHARGIVHRDIKPENLFVVEAHGIKTLKILDFGISKAALADHSQHFRTDGILGSPIYMSPEQLRSTASVDLRTDIWSVGSVLYEMLTGTTPFGSNVTLPQLVAQVVFDAPRDLNELRPGIDPNLAAVVMRCLEKEPEARWPNTAELACALLPWAPKRAYPVAERALAMVADSELPSSGNNVKMPSYRPGPSVSAAESPTMRFVPTEEHRSTASNLVRARGESVAPPKREVSTTFVATVAAAAAALGLVTFVSFKPGPLPAQGAAAPAGTVDIVLRAEPRDTRFSIDDGPPLENPWVGHAPRDGRTHVIHARAPGHQEKTRDVTFDRDVTLGMLLTKEPKR